MRKNYIFLFLVILFLNYTTEAKTSSSFYTATNLKTIIDPPTVNGPDEICGATSVTLTASSSGSGNIIRWYDSSAGGTLLFTGASYSVLVTASTTFYAEVENNGETSTRTPHPITMYSLPVISNSGPVCVGETLPLSGSGTPATNNPWSSSNTAIATVNNTGVVTGVSAGNVTITYRTSNGCQSTTTIVVQARPAANVGSANSVCIDSSIIIGAPAVSGHTYEWTADSGDPGFSSTQSNPSVSPSATTTYTLTETNTATGCSRTNTITVNVRPKPVITDFTFINNVCSGTQIQFSPFVTGGTAPNHYSWDFGDGQTATNASPTHRFNSYGCGTEVFNVTLTVTDAFGCVSTSMTKQLTIIQQPDTNFFDPNAADPSLEFNNCQNASTAFPSFSITVDNASMGSCILSYDINWGDGTSETGISFPLSHTYANLGVYPMSITAYAANGCDRTRIYNVRNISNPSGGLYSPGSTTNLCAPTAPLQFAITGWYSNSTDTQYQLTYGDGSPPVIITQNEMLASPYFNPVSPSTSQNYPVPHSYTVSNCPGSAFQIHLRISNACGYTDAYIGPINVNTSTLPDFVSPPNACVNTSVLFDNTSMVGTGNSCNGLSRYSWNFGDGTPVVNTPFVTGAPDMNHTYAVPGVYTVTLTAISYCTSDAGGLVISKTICIESPLPAATYTVDTLNGCAPLAVQATNTTDVSGSCDPVYLWQVIYIPTNCGSTPGASYNYFTNGTSAASANPSFNLPNAGKYRIRLTITNSCGPVITTKDIIVKQPPIASIAPVADLCGADAVTLTPQLTTTNCGDNPLTYLWSFPGGTPATSTDAAPSVIYDTPGSHTFSVQVSNECGTVSDSETFSISPTVIADAGTDVTICQGDSTTLNGAASGGVPGYTYSWSPGTGLSSTSVINPVATPTVTTTYILTVRDSQNCPKTDQVTVYVNSLNQGSVGNSQTICSGDDPVAFTSGTASATGTITYQWEISTISDSAGFTDIPGATDAVYDSPPLTQHTWFRRRVISTLNGLQCIKTTNVVEIIINDIDPGAIAADQQICSGGDPAAFTSVSPASGLGTLTYAWQSSTDNVSWSGISGTPNPTYDASPLTETTYFRRRVTSNLNGVLCTAYSNVITVTVVPDPVVTQQPLATQTICQGAAVATLTVQASGGLGIYSYQWFSNTTNSTTGGTAITGQVNDNFTPVLTTAGTFYYYVVITAEGPGCSVTSAAAQVIVIPAPAISTQPASSSVCIGGTPTLLNVAYTNGTGTPTYQWYSNTTDSTTGGTALPGETGTSYQPLADAVGTTYYYAIITFPSGGCNSITSNTAEVAVTAAPEVSTQPEPLQDICVGGSVAALSVAYTRGSGTPSYQWYSNTTASNTGGTPIPLATADSYTPPAFAATGDYYYYVTITLSAGGCSPITSDPAQVHVVPDPVMDTQPLATQTSCQNGAPVTLEVAASGGVGAISYQWYSNTANNNTGGTLIPGEDQATFVPPTTALGTMYYYSIATATGAGCSVTSTVAQVITVEAPFVTTQPASSSVCVGGTPALLTVAYTNGTGTPTYQWYSNTTDSTMGGTAIPSATGTSYQPLADTAATTYYYVVITFPSGGCSFITSNTATVEVAPMPSITAQPAPSQDICVGGSVPAFTIASDGGTGTVSYQWYSNSTNSNTGGTAIGGATASSYTPPVFAVTGTYYYYAMITVSGSGCGILTSDVAVVNVVPDPQVTTQPLASQPVCQDGTPIDLTVAATGGVGALSYQWYFNTTPSTTGGTLIPGADEASYTPETTALGTVYYYAVITAAGSGCSVTSAAAEVIVIDSPVFTTQPQSETLCFGETPAMLSVAFANGTGTATYQWFSNTVDDTAGATALPGADSATYQPSGADSGTVYYFATVTFSSGGCSLIYSNVVPVTLYPLPEITTPQADVVCNNETFAYAPANGGGNVIPAGTQYSWTAPTGTGFTGGTAQATPQASITQTLTNTTNAPVTATYTVTPVSNGCDGDHFTLTITVNPEPQIPAVAMDICSGGGFTIMPDAIPGAIVPANVTYSWDVPTVTGGITGGATGTSQPFIGGSLVNPTNVPQTAIYTINIVSPPGVCAGDPFTVTITVNPTPYVDITQTATICSSGTFTVTPTNGSGNIIPANTTYTWTDPVISPAGAITGGSAQATGQTNIAQALVNTTSDIATATYTVTPNSGDCPGDTFEVVVTVNPVPTVDDITPQTLCGGSATTTVTFTGATAGTIYNWTNNTASIGLATSGQGDIPSFVAVNGGISPVTATITVTPVFDGCPGAPKSFTITVNPAPMVSFSAANQAICSGAASAAVTLTSTTPGASITWTAVQPAGLTGVATSGTTTIPAQTITNSTSSPITVTYTAVAATSDASACPGPVATYSIVVNPVPFVSAPMATAICSGQTATVLPVDGAPNNIPAGTTYTWTTPTGSGFTGGTAQAAPQSSFVQTLVNTTNAPVTATYSVTPSSNGCTGVPFTVTVTVNPKAIIGNATQTICTGGTFTVNPADFATLLPAGTVYNWSAPTVTGGVTGGTAGSGETVVSGTLVNPSAGVQTATYVVTPVSPDGNCAGATFNVVVTVSPTFSVASVVSDYNGFQISVAGGTDGSIDLTPTGGSGTYTYVWSGPGGFAANTQDVSNLAQGNYTVTISDGLCNDIVLQFQLVEPLPLVIQEVIASHVNVKCFGENTGVIEVAITTVSVAPFDYAILLPDGTIVENVLNTNAENYVFDNLPAGTYTIRVTDANGTVKNLAGIVITQPAAALAISNSVVSNFNGFGISCNGANNGSIDITVSGGTAGYTYAWSGPGTFTATTQDISALPPGSYTVVVTDNTGVCTVTQTYTITEPLPLALSSVVSDFNGFQIACFGGNSGSIDTTPTGGTGIYTYQWSGPNGFAATTQDVANLVAGTYTLALTDNNNCALGVQTYTLNQPTAIAITETHVNVLCFGDNTGSIDVTVTGGVTSVTGNYTFAWTGPNSFTAATEDLTNIPAGTYNLTVTDNSGCTKNLVVTITQQPEIIITPTTTPITCYGANNASISLAITGGDAPYVVTWSNLATGTFQDNLAAGTYTITVTDDSNCTKQATVVINEAPIFTVNPVFTHVTCHGAHDGSIALNLIGGQAPVTLTWSDGSTAGTTRNNLGPGTYTATIFDGTPCQIVRTFTIVEPAALSIGANLTHATVCNDPQSGAIDLHPAGGTLPYTFVWSNGATTEDLTGLTSGNYSVTVTDANGCSQTKQYTITRQEPMTMTVDQDVQFNCDNHTVIQTNIARASGGVPPFNYTWSAGTVSGGNGQMMNTDVNGTYIVTATDAVGCTTNFTFEVNTERLGQASFLIDSYANATYSLYSIYDPIQFTNTSTGDYTGVSWSFGDGSVSDEENTQHTYVREGLYLVTQTVTYPYGCVDKKTLVITVQKGYDVMIPNGFTPNDDDVNDTFTAVFKGLKSIELKVYDTWGALIYSEKGDVIRGWDGTLNGVPSENGNYVYKITAETFYGHFVSYDGPFVLIK